PPPETDDDLARVVREGSLDALGQVYARHGAAVYAAAYRILGVRADAEDVLQDVFVGLARALAGYQERGKLQAWLRRVAVRAALMRLRARGRRREQPFADLPEAAGPTGDGALDRVALQAALRALPDKLRTVFVLKEIEGYSHDEVAGLLGISAGTSAVRLFRAWKLLRTEVTNA
ncbi:sigma-70 family RNA polymerase sigma factor, partial [Longimicrobium sp.]|uniref:RNA polymerase sigma factor n=1 Tax=Longimicrobium sp. TaxID=2029185 RepID=UPI002E327A96